MLACQVIELLWSAIVVEKHVWLLAEQDRGHGDAFFARLVFLKTLRLVAAHGQLDLYQLRQKEV